MAFVLILVGFIPSLVWLHFYLRKVNHPEPRKLLLEVFFFGILLAPLAVAAQWLFAYIVSQFAPGFDIGSSSTFFLWSAFVEEVVKLIAVYYLVVHHAEFSEPVDIMIYMVTASLGFAALENILVLFKNIPDGVSITMQILLFRTVGATLLHALSSALVGYFFALGWYYHHHSRKFLWFGVGIATLFHFTFNTLLLNFTALGGLMTSSILLLGVLFLVSVLFHRVQERSQTKFMV
ncbi:MAG: PrsW family glutamic-type intramembrane protease [Patescibacteria group bacterium]